MPQYSKDDEQFKWNKYIERFDNILDDSTVVFSYITQESITVPKSVAHENHLHLDSKLGKLLIDEGFIIRINDDPYEEYCVRQDASRYANGMLDVILHLNYDCNLRCPYCYQNNLPKNVVMSQQTLDRTIDEIEDLIRDRGFRKLFLTLIGGEPSMHPELVEHLRKRISNWNGDTVITGEVVTNGTLLTDQFIDSCLSIGITDFDITVDGPQQTHDKLRFCEDGGGTYADIMKTIQRIQTLYPKARLCINYNLSQQNENGVEQLCSGLRSNGYSGKLMFSRVFQSPNSTFTDVLRPNDDVWMKAVNIAEHYDFIQPAFFRTQKMYCPMYNDSTYIVDPQGYVWSCINGVGLSPYREGPFANRNSWEWKLARARRLESVAPAFPMCKTCKFLPVCGGGCAYRNESIHPTCLRSIFENNELRILKEHLAKEYSYNCKTNMK